MGGCSRPQKKRTGPKARRPERRVQTEGGWGSGGEHPGVTGARALQPPSIQVKVWHVARPERREAGGRLCLSGGGPL